MPERETLDVDVLIVGAGPAGLATAYHLRKSLDRDRASDVSVAVIEKGKEVGAHIISGAVMDPRGIAELIPDWEARGAPVESPVLADELYYLTPGRKFSLPLIPPPLRNHGNKIISLNRFTRWLGSVVEESGVDIFPGFSGARLLMDGDRVSGVRTGDKGVDRNGTPKANHDPGIDIRAKVTVLAEGARGSLAKQVVSRLGLDAGKNPQAYSVGVKEVWKTPHRAGSAGRVIHTLGFPLSTAEFGGGFLYHMADDMVSVGLVVGLDYGDPRIDPHGLFQDFKRHPVVRDILGGGSLLSYGAKAIPEGGYWSIPQTYADGCLLLGDTAGLLNSMRLKGIHLAIKSGMLAADAIIESLARNDFSRSQLERFEQLMDESWLKTELWGVRNFHQGFQGGLWAGMFHAGLQMLTGGRGLRNRYPSVPGHERMQRLDDVARQAREEVANAGPTDCGVAVDKLTDVFHSGTAHDEDQPVHLVVLEPDLCTDRCTKEYGNPCQHFCPAAVYAMEPGSDGKVSLEINASNCVHCKTCDIMDPYQIINWECPEGGGGPGYEYL